jgi:methionyl aminopeptidase
MTIGSQEELEKLRIIGRAVAATLRHMGALLEPGMTTAELDAVGRAKLESFGARSAPELAYGFPGATCISIAPEVAHGIPGPQVVEAGALVNIDVSAEKDGFFADTGASFAVPPVNEVAAHLCAATREALTRAVKTVRAGRRFNAIGRAVEKVAHRHGLSIIENLQSHGVGRSLHEEPGHIPTYYDPSDRRVIAEGAVFTIEPFLSNGARMAEDGGDGWTLVTDTGHLTAQYEHSVVATRKGVIVLTQ